MKTNKLYLGVDTSNYTTSLSLVSDGCVIKQARRLLPVEKGSRGLRQSDAVFFHTKALPELSKELFECEQYSKENLCGIGVSVTPRDEVGSYMPCFLSGLSYASGISHANNIPMYTFSHQAGHISAGISSCEDPQVFSHKEFFAFHVSGGTTEALLCKYENSTYSCKIVGGTKDASAGQIIDRAGVLCDLQFPCGRELDDIAKSSENVIKPVVSMDGAYFHMSGLQNKFEKYIADGIALSDAAAFLFGSIASALKKSLEALRGEYGHKPCLFVGGVMCNSHIRKELLKLSDVYFACAELSRDNACGVAILAENAMKSEE